MIEIFTAPWFQRILKSNPNASLRNVECPVLAINGGKDMQILPKENLNAIRNALVKGGNETITIMELPNLNHLFLRGSNRIDGRILNHRADFLSIALTEIVNWIRNDN
ncbi:MAG: hypothetical protein R2804_09050 [Cyclobacteriaceae bacterium]